MGVMSGERARRINKFAQTDSKAVIWARLVNDHNKSAGDQTIVKDLWLMRERGRWRRKVDKGARIEKKEKNVDV